jgi:hypothetical protein
MRASASGGAAENWGTFAFYRQDLESGGLCAPLAPVLLFSDKVLSKDRSTLLALVSTGGASRAGT